MHSRSLIPHRLLAVLVALPLAACQGGIAWDPSGDRPNEPATVDQPRLLQANAEPEQWLAHGRTYAEERHSPLDQIDVDSVAELGLAWSFDLETQRGIEATSLVIDGVLYTTSAWSIVHALDARTGAPLWRYDPQVARDKSRHACCDVVNRGVAAWKGSLFLGALDGRLIALDARTGEVQWSVATVDAALPYTITGAPRDHSREGAHRERRRRVRRPRLPQRLRRKDGRTARLAIPHRARRSGARASRATPWRWPPRPGKGAMVGARRRWRHRLGFDGLRPGARPALHRRRQRYAVEPGDPLTGRRRQPLPLVDRGPAPRHRRVRLALPDDTGRDLGLHRDAAHHPRRSSRSTDAERKVLDAGAEEWLLLRHRSA